MQLHVLGSAAGGGVPQWNCDCSICAAARDERLPHRTQASVAASARGDAWVLFNVTTDIRAQIERDPALRPRPPRSTPIAAVFLTDANIDHCAGLLDLRQAGDLLVCSTRVVRDTLLRHDMFAPFAKAPRRWAVVDDGPVEAGGLVVRAIAVTALLPAYAGGAPTAGAACAYMIEDSQGSKVLYAPVFASLDAPLLAAAADADVAFFDGSFFSDDELVAAGLGTRTAAEMGHAPIGGADGTLDALRSCPCPRKLYTHLNNSNPVLDPASPQARLVREAAIDIAQDGEIIAPSERADRVRSRA